MRKTGLLRAAAFAVALLAAATTGAGAQSGALRGAIDAFEAGRLQEARTAFEALVGGAGEVTARLYLGRIHIAREEYDDAEDHLERAVELAPDNAEIVYWLGNSYMGHIDHVSLFGRRGMAHRARDTMIRALEIDPRHIPARQALGGYYLHAPGIVGGDRDRARDQARELIALDARVGYLFLAEIHGVEEQWDAAEAAYARALSAAPDDPEVLYAVGMSHQSRERWSDALDLFQRAAASEVTPDTRPWIRSALYQVGRTGALSGTHLDVSIAALLEFNERFPEREDILSAGAHWRLGMLYELKSDAEAARAAYRAALDIDPDHEESKRALNRLGR